ncbi:unnamed protein product, partial [marine sediment metagenome]
MANLTTGANAEGYEAFCDDIYNYLKNSWRQVDPCSMAGLTAGMVVSDEADNKLYHAILESDCDCSEIVQTCVPVSDDKYVTFGDTNYGEIGYNTDNEALMLGIPVDPNLGLIICNITDILVDMTGLITAHTQPVVWFVDLDLDSYLGVGHQADDKPGIWAGGSLHIQYDGNGDVVLFQDGGDGVNRVLQIYGWNTDYASEMPTELYFHDTYDEFFIEANNYSDHEGVTVSLLEEYQEFRVRGIGGLLGLEFIPNFTNGPLMIINDIDTDSSLYFGWVGDDIPDIWADRDLNIMHNANFDVHLFQGCEGGENRLLYIWGGDTTSG